VTASEARKAQQRIDEIHEQMNARRPYAPDMRTQIARPITARAALCSPRAFVADASLDTSQLLTAIEKHFRNLTALLADGFDESLRGPLARPVLQLLQDELRLLEARLDNGGVQP
jgi:hypothetical protein